MDDALRTLRDGAALRGTWHAVLQELTRDPPPESDREWMNDRLYDLQLHVYNSPQWRRHVEAVETARRDLLDRIGDSH
jgi:hypothetical protein